MNYAEHYKKEVEKTEKGKTYSHPSVCGDDGFFLLSDWPDHQKPDGDAPVEQRSVLSDSETDLSESVAGSHVMVL